MPISSPFSLKSLRRAWIWVQSKVMLWVSCAMFASEECMVRAMTLRMLGSGSV